MTDPETKVSVFKSEPSSSAAKKTGGLFFDEGDKVGSDYVSSAAKHFYSKTKPNPSATTPTRTTASQTAQINNFSPINWPPISPLPQMNDTYMNETYAYLANSPSYNITIMTKYWH